MSTGSDSDSLNLFEKNDYYSIGEVSSITELKQSILRFWETEFEELAPKKNKFGHRVYYKKDIEIILKIKLLLYEKGLTIKGAKNYLKNESGTKINSSEIKKKLFEILSILKEN